MLSYLAAEPLAVWFIGEGLGDFSVNLVLVVPDRTRAGELGSWATLDLQRDLSWVIGGAGFVVLHIGTTSPCIGCLHPLSFAGRLLLGRCTVAVSLLRRRSTLTPAGLFLLTTLGTRTTEGQEGY